MRPNVRRGRAKPARDQGFALEIICEMGYGRSGTAEKVVQP